MNEAQDDAINCWFGSHGGNWLHCTPRRLRAKICEAAVVRPAKKAGTRIWKAIHEAYPGLYAGRSWVDNSLGPELRKLCLKHR